VDAAVFDGDLEGQQIELAQGALVYDRVADESVGLGLVGHKVLHRRRDTL
jgi:hypothetical protein